MNYFKNCMYFSSNLLSRHLNSMADEAFKKLDFTPTQGFTLIVIGELNKHTPSEIATELEMKPSTITRFLDQLVKLGYVDRVYLGRKTEVNLTEQGKDKLKEVYECWRLIDLRIVETFGKDFGKQLTTDISKANLLFNGKNNKKG